MTAERQNHTGDITLSIPSDERHIYLVEIVISYLVKEIGFGEETGRHISLAVVEAATNAIKHGNKGDPEKTVEFRFHIAKDRLAVFVRDCGSGFGLEEIEDPRSPENLMKPCGRGIFLMRTLMDKVEYNMDEDRGTEVQLVKYRNSAERQIIEGHSSYSLKITLLMNVLADTLAHVVYGPDFAG